MVPGAVIITGATSGIGRAVAGKLAGRGLPLVFGGRSQKKLAAMVTEFEARGLEVAAQPGDLKKQADAERLVDLALETFGAVGTLIHSAGVFRLNLLQDTPPEEFRDILETNLFSLYYLTHKLAPHLYKRKQGHILAVSSVAARVGFAKETAYCASKWGLMGFLAALREEARPHGVKISALVPGATVTPAWDAYQGTLPLERMMDVDTVAGAAVYMLDQPPEACVDELVLAPSAGPFVNK